MVALKLIHELVEHNEDYNDISEGLDWFIIPVLNVDGYVYSHLVVSLNIYVIIIQMMKVKVILEPVFLEN